MLKAATSLSKAHKTLSPEPLITPEELDAFFFNGKGWYGVHPLVVDVLKTQEELPATAPGGTQ